VHHFGYYAIGVLFRRRSDRLDLRRLEQFGDSSSLSFLVLVADHGHTSSLKIQKRKGAIRVRVAAQYDSRMVADAQPTHRT
jgi:hypothetical protein